jgi:hypothetical protein
MSSSAIVVSLRSYLNRSGSDSNHLEYHPEASRRYNATTVYVQKEEVRLGATHEGPKSFLDNQRRVPDLCCCQHTFFARVPL